MTRSLLVLLFFLTGCGGHYEALSSGSVGCAPNAINVNDVANNGPTTTWQATCNGRTFYCTQVSNGTVSCAN